MHTDTHESWKQCTKSASKNNMSIKIYRYSFKTRNITLTRNHIYPVGFFFFFFGGSASAALSLFFFLPSLSLDVPETNHVKVDLCYNYSHFGTKIWHLDNAMLCFDMWSRLIPGNLLACMEEIKSNITKQPFITNTTILHHKISSKN